MDFDFGRVAHAPQLRFTCGWGDSWDGNEIAWLGDVTNIWTVCADDLEELT